MGSDQAVGRHVVRSCAQPSAHKSGRSRHEKSLCGCLVAACRNGRWSRGRPRPACPGQAAGLLGRRDRHYRSRWLDKRLLPQGPSSDQGKRRTCPCRRTKRHLAGRRAAEEACRDPGLGQHGSDQSLAQLGEVQGTPAPSREIRKSARVHGRGLAELGGSSGARNRRGRDRSRPRCLRRRHVRSLRGADGADREAPLNFSAAAASAVAAGATPPSAFHA